MPRSIRLDPEARISLEFEEDFLSGDEGVSIIQMHSTGASKVTLTKDQAQSIAKVVIAKWGKLE